VAQEVNIYGDQHRFLPILAQKYGFRVLEVKALQSKKDTGQRSIPWVRTRGGCWTFFRYTSW